MTIPFGGALAALMGRPAYAATGDIGVAGIDPLYAPVYVAQANGYFGEAGIAAAAMNAQSGPRVKQLLAAGQVAAGVSGASDSVALTVAGKQSVLVYAFDVTSPFANIMVSKTAYDAGLKTLKDLNGRSLGVTAPQSATWLMATYLTEQAGAKSQIKPLGDFTTMMGALKSGAVDAVMATFAMLEKGKSEGWGVPLFDVSDLAAWNAAVGGPVPGVGCYVLGDAIKDRPADVQAMVTGLCRAMDYLHANTAETIAKLLTAAYLPGYGMADVVSSVETFKKTWSKTNLISEDEYTRISGIMGSGRMYSDAQMAGPGRYADNVDISFVQRARKPKG